MRETAAPRSTVPAAKKQVSFSHTTRVMFVPSLYEMTNAEMSAYWYTDDDSDMLQGDIVNTIKCMRKGINSADVCTRGLEHMRSAQHLNERKFLKSSTMDAVLEEQERQRCSGEFDLEEIARASEACSRVAADLALTLAAADESFVRRTIKRKSRSPSVPPTQQRPQRRTAKAGAAKEADLCFNVLEKALTISSKPGNKNRKSASSFVPQEKVSHYTSVNSSRISRVLGAAGEQQKQMGSPNIRGKPQPSVATSIDLIKNKMSTGLKDEVLVGPGTKMGRSTGVLGLRAMMMRRNDTYTAKST